MSPVSPTRSSRWQVFPSRPSMSSVPLRHQDRRSLIKFLATKVAAQSFSVIKLAGLFFSLSPPLSSPLYPSRSSSSSVMVIPTSVPNNRTGPPSVPLRTTTSNPYFMACQFSHQWQYPKAGPRRSHRTVRVNGKRRKGESEGRQMGRNGGGNGECDRECERLRLKQDKSYVLEIKA
jgi:hypothetical protein